MADWLWNGDLVAGVGAAAVFLVLVIAINLSPIVGAGLALVAYLGIRLVLPRPDDLVPVLRSCQDRVDEIGRLVPRLDPTRRPLGSKNLGEIHQSLIEILSLIRSDRATREYARPFLSDYLTPISAVLVPYVRLAGKDVQLADADLTAAENDTMPRILDELAKLKEDLYRSDVTRLRTGKELVDLMTLPIVSRPKDDDR
jgi:hypothetical protein